MKEIKERITQATTVEELEEIVIEVAELGLDVCELPDKSEVIAKTNYLNSLQWLAKRRITELENKEFGYYKAWIVECKRQLTREQNEAIREKVVEKVGYFSGRK